MQCVVLNHTERLISKDCVESLPLGVFFNILFWNYLNKVSKSQINMKLPILLFIMVILAFPVYGQFIYGRVYLDGETAKDVPIMFIDNNKDIRLINTNNNGEYVITIPESWSRSQIYQILCYNTTKCAEKVVQINSSKSQRFEKNYYLQSCNPTYSMVFEFKSFEKDYVKESLYQDYLDLSEDDVLRLDRLIIQNNVDCKINGYSIDFEIEYTNGKIFDPFGISSINLPPLSEREQYILEHKSQNYTFFYGSKFYFNEYELSKDYIFYKRSTKFIGTVPLSNSGDWIFKAFSYKDTNPENKSEVMVSFKDKSNSILSPKLKVIDKKTQQALTLQKNISKISIITTFITTIIGVFLGWVLSVIFSYTKEKRIQRILLKNLNMQLNSIKVAIEGHIKILKTGTIPSYFIPQLDINTYLTRLDLKYYKLNEEDETKSKDIIFQIHNKILNINNLIEKMTDTFILQNHEGVGLLKIEIKDKDFKYHKTLEELISQLENKLNFLSINIRTTTELNIKMPKYKLSQKEKNLFFSGLLGGIAGGLLANFLVASFFQVFHLGLLHNSILFIFILIAFFGFYYYLFKQIKPIK